MNFRKKMILIFTIIFLLGSFIQITRVNTYMKYQSNKEMSDPLDVKGQKIDQSTLENADDQKILIVYDDKDDTLKNLKDNIAKTLSYMKINYDTVLSADFKNSDLSLYQNIIVADGNFASISDNYKIFDYADNGGKVFFATALYQGDSFNEIEDKLGIKSVKNQTKTEGFKFLENLLLKSKGVTIEDAEITRNISADAELYDDIKKYAEDLNGIVLLWSRHTGAGDIFYFNGTMLSEKENRGVISAVLSVMNTDFIYPVMNTKINFIDDFPSPVPYGDNQSIREEYGLNIRRFYKEIWLSDMLKIASTNNMKYTGVTIGTYDDETSDLSDSTIDIDKADFEYYARELFAAGGELGLHGYNHQPLIKYECNDEGESYTPWKSDDTIKEGINKMKDFTKSELYNYKLRTYVPPSNIISEDGIKTLKEADSDIKIISSLYTANKGATQYVQDIAVNDDGSIYLPRITAGYQFTDAIKWDILNSVTSNGYVSHFVHPDDVLDSERNYGEGWKTLSKNFGNMNNYIYTNFKWLNASTATDAANQLIAYKNTDISYQKTENYINIFCDNFTKPIYFILRTNKVMGSGKNCDVTLIDDSTYLIKVKNAVSTVNLS